MCSGFLIQKNVSCCFLPEGGVVVLLVSPGVGGVGATVYVVVILQAVLGRSHHVRRFHRGPENRGKLFNNAVKSRKWPQDISTQVSMVTNM